MKRHFWTRNLWLGVLMTLVLALGVLETADALSFTSQITRTDKQKVSFVYPNQTFDLRFTVRKESSTAVRSNTKKASQSDINFAKGDSTRPATPDPLTSNYTQTVDASGYDPTDTHYYTVTTTSADHNGSGFTLTTHTRNWVTEDEAYYYNQEAVTIDPGSNISIVSINGYTVNKNAGDSETLNEDENWGGTTTSELSQTTITVRFQAGVTVGQGAGNQITVEDATPTTDYPNGSSDTATAPTSSPFQITVVHRIPGDATTIPTLDSVSATSIIRPHDTRTPITATLGWK